MFIIWKGWGILVVPILAFCFIIVGGIISLSGAALGANSATTGFMIIALSFGIAGYATYLVGKRLNEGSGKLLIEKETGEEIRLRSSHSLFFIRMEYYGYIFAVISALALISWFFSLFLDSPKSTI